MSPFAGLDEEWDFSTRDEKWTMLAEGRTPPLIKERIVALTEALMRLDLEKAIARQSDVIARETKRLAKLRERRGRG